MKKDKIIGVRVNSQEYKYILEKCKQLKITPSQLIRTLIISQL